MIFCLLKLKIRSIPSPPSQQQTKKIKSHHKSCLFQDHWWFKEKNYPLIVVQSREFQSSPEILNAKAISLRQQGRERDPTKLSHSHRKKSQPCGKKGQWGDFSGKVLTDVNFKNLTEQEHYNAYVKDVIIKQ